MQRLTPTFGSVIVYRPVRGDTVRVGLRSVYVGAPGEALGLEVGLVLRMEVPLPNGVTIQPHVRVTGVDADFFTGDYLDLGPDELAAIEAYYASRPSRREILAAHA